MKIHVSKLKDLAAKWMDEKVMDPAKGRRASRHGKAIG